MMKIVDTVVLVVSVAATIGLLGSYTAPYVDPNVFYPSSLLGLGYHYLLLGNLVLFGYWLVRWRRMALVSLAVILCGYPFIRTYYGFNSDEEAGGAAGDVSLMSYNICQMTLRDSCSREGIAGYVEAFDGDFVCLQEFPKGESAYALFPSYVERWRHGDAAILSRRPFASRGSVSFPKGCSASCVYADIVLPKDTVRVYCVHLESYRLGRKEQKIYRELTGGTSDDISQGVKAILGRLVAANKNRAREAAIIKRHMRESPHPVVICGDFNDTPLSYPYHLLHQDLRDSFVEKGRGLGNTYIGEFPSFRIDHILHDAALETVSYLRDTVLYSDHYAIQAKMKLK